MLPALITAIAGLRATILIGISFFNLSHWDRESYR